jgi:hypothetical protein
MNTCDVWVKWSNVNKLPERLDMVVNYERSERGIFVEVSGADGTLTLKF